MDQNGEKKGEKCSKHLMIVNIKYSEQCSPRRKKSISNSDAPAEMASMYIVGFDDEHR